MARSDAVWNAEGTTPDEIEAALRRLLAERHAESASFFPARVLNMIAFVDDEWSGEIANRLRGVGRYAPSRLLVLSYERGRERLDARVSIASDADPEPGQLALLRETVVVRLGDRHLDDLLTIADPLVVTDLPTLLWSPHGHAEAVDALLSLAQATLLDSIEEPDHSQAGQRAAIDRAYALSQHVYVVDLAWLRSTPWRERVATVFDPPAMRRELHNLCEVKVRHHPDSRVAGLLLIGWLGARLGWSLKRSEVSEEAGEGTLCSAESESGEVKLQAPPGTRAARPRPRRRRADEQDGTSRASGPRAGRSARASPRSRWARAYLDAARCLARRGRHPWRGHPPGAAARPDLRRLAGRHQADAAGGRARMTSLTTCADAEAAAQRAAAEIARRLQNARRERGVAHLALSGGSTPARTYELLASELQDWKDVELWFADERCVGPDDEESNFRLAGQTLIAHATGLDEQRVHRMVGELGPDEGARSYAVQLRQHAPAQDDGGLPTLDVIVLGIGPDGHVASLFPGAPTLDAGDDELCLGVHDSPKPPPERITLTLAVLRAAERCVLLATGASKADAINAMLGEPTHHVPASLLRRGRLSVIVDDAASPAPLQH